MYLFSTPGMEKRNSGKLKDFRDPGQEPVINTLNNHRKRNLFLPQGAFLVGFADIPGTPGDKQRIKYNYGDQNMYEKSRPYILHNYETVSLLRSDILFIRIKLVAKTSQ